MGFIAMNGAAVPRRRILQFAGVGLALTCAAYVPQPTFALRPGKPSKERLLQRTREEKTEEQIAEEKVRMEEEKKVRLDRQRELEAAAERKKTSLNDYRENEIEIESNLRGQYYFPTARKRYLPRVKRAWDSLASCEEAVSQGDWAEVTQLSQDELIDAVLPMRLYASSLSGGGLSINARFIEKMNSETVAYENAVRILSDAAKRHDEDIALEKLSEMKAAMRKYRESGRLEAPDFGIGEIPRDNRVGSGFGNNNSTLYGRNKGLSGDLQDSDLRGRAN